MNQRERMVSGLPYKAWLDGLPEARMRAKRLWAEYNALDPDDNARRDAILDELLGAHGAEPYIEAPFRCDYGSNLTVGDYF